MTKRNICGLSLLCVASILAAADVDDRPSPVRYGSSRRTAPPVARPVPVNRTASPAPASKTPVDVAAAIDAPVTAPDTETGLACYYNPAPGGPVEASASIERAAHRSYPLGSLVRVTQLSTGKSTVVRITDRVTVTGERIISVSRRAAEDLAFVRDGTTRVRVELLKPADMAN